VRSRLLSQPLLQLLTQQLLFQKKMELKLKRALLPLHQKHQKLLYLN